MSIIDGTTITWNFTIQTIKSGKCILFIGPEIFAPSPDLRLSDKLRSFLDIDNDEGVRLYDDDLFYFKERQKKTITYYKIKQFYNQRFQETEDILKKIAQIPFHYIISINPDKKLKEIFDELEFKANFDFYWKKHAPNNPQITKPSRDRPLIYNLFGSVDNYESLVLTHDDLFDFLESIFEAKSMPDQLKHNIQDADNFIFLGFEFDKWYVQLLLRVLHFHNNEAFVKYASNQAVTEDLQVQCYEQFKINFVQDDIPAFVDALYNKCVEDNFIRKKKNKGESVTDGLKKDLAKGDVKQVITKLGEFLESLGEEDLLERQVMCSHRYNRLQKRIMNHVIKHEDEVIENNQLIESLLHLLDDAKKLE